MSVTGLSFHTWRQALVLLQFGLAYFTLSFQPYFFSLALTLSLA